MNPNQRFALDDRGYVIASLNRPIPGKLITMIAMTRGHPMTATYASASCSFAFASS